jgi:ferrous iron transport protein B
MHRRLLDMGVVRGSTIELIRKAPLGGPLEISLGNMRLSLRLAEANNIIVALKDKTDTSKKKDFFKIALAGNPNSGKTATFNRLCGAFQRVGNWPGVTVERKEGNLLTENSGIKAKVVDLPGIYSLTPYSEEEIVSREFILNENPDLIVNIIDTTSLARSLNLTLQLMELNIPMILALNIYDEAEEKGIKITIGKLSKLLGMPVVKTVATKGEGIEDLSKIIESSLCNGPERPSEKVVYGNFLETLLESITEILEEDKQLCNTVPSRWLALKILEEDEPVFHLLHERTIWMNLEPIIQQANKSIRSHYNGEPQTFLADERVAFIRGALKECTQWSPACEQKDSLSDNLDKLFLNRWLGLPIFLFILWSVFQITFKLGQFPMEWIENFFDWTKSFAAAHIHSPAIQSLTIDGILSGVGGVLIFFPLILILFLLLSFLEDSGYMARIAFLVDSLMHKIGLHGRSFLPMIMGFGCTVPALMACRTLKNKSDRLTTMLILPLMSCGARLPVYMFIAGAFFAPEEAGNVILMIYLLGVALSCICALILKNTLFKGLSEPFVMELPPYRFPSIKSMFLSGWHSCLLYLKKAATIILGASIILWFMLNYPQPKNTVINPPSQAVSSSQSMIKKADTLIKEAAENSSFEKGIQNSIAGRLGKLFEPLMKPLGFDWKITVSLISGLAAKEVVVSTMATIYASDAPEALRKETGHLSQKELSSLLKNSYDKSTALAFMVFVLIYIPCLAALGVFHKEAGNLKYTILLIVYTTALAWIGAYSAKLTALYLLT